MVFSITTLSQSNSKNLQKNSNPWRFLPSSLFCSKYLAPLTAKCVQGGNAIIISHFSFSSGSTSPCICHSGCPPLHSCMSQEKALCPRARNALHTSWLSSQATSTFIMSLPFLSFSRTKSADSFYHISCSANSQMLIMRGTSQKNFSIISSAMVFSLNPPMPFLLGLCPIR